MKRKDLEQVFDEMSSSKSRRLDSNLIGDPSSAFQVLDQRPLKRKDFEEAFDDMSSHFSKSRRLDADLRSTMADNHLNGIEALEQGGLPVALLEENDKALVLYNPANTFYKTPAASTDFSIVVNSDLIPGLRDRIFAQGRSMWGKPVEAGESGCMAIVPWVESNWPPSPRRETQPASPSAGEVEMMDTDDTSSDGSKPSELQRWQQHQHQQLHYLQPQLSSYTYTPITW